jgi:hypothetical protein
MNQADGEHIICERGPKYLTGGVGGFLGKKLSHVHCAGYLPSGVRRILPVLLRRFRLAYCLTNTCRRDWRILGRLCSAAAASCYVAASSYWLSGAAVRKRSSVSGLHRCPSSQSRLSAPAPSHQQQTRRYAATSLRPRASAGARSEKVTLLSPARAGPS